MKIPSLLCSLVAATSIFFSSVAGQTESVFTDPKTGISFCQATFDNSSTVGGFSWGFALPPEAASTDYPDYIGTITGAINSGTGWTGVSHNSGMPNGLLLVLWAYQGQIHHSFRYATGYVEPTIYTGNVTFTLISSTITANNFTVVYKCGNCFASDSSKPIYGQSTSGGVLVVAWAQAYPYPQPPTSDDGTVVQHDNGMGIYGQPIADCTNSKYSSWATMTATATATATATTTKTGSASATTTAATNTAIPYKYKSVPTGVTYDYVVVGGGAGGVPFADKVSAAGKKTLLIERGPPSSGRWGGTMKPNWLVGTNLTRFDVPGLCNQIWHDSAGIACTDTDQMAGCVLGGGTAVNAGLWWKPNPKDWDVNFPTGWKSTDMTTATNRVFTRIPGTDHPSMDGKLYLQQGFDVVSTGLTNAGWKSVVANNVPEQKNRTYAHTPYMFINGERGGPLATYLVSANARSNFALWMNTTVKRVIRTGGHVTGVEVEPFGDNGYLGIVNVTTASGRVVLSAGTFGSAKILLRSGIGPADQLAIVQKSTDGPTMINSTAWINLPVGSNLDDHVNTDVVINHPNVTYYDFYGAWDNPNATDKSLYLNKRSGILAQAAPNIGPMFWEEITGADGIVRQLQWTARVEGPTSPSNPNQMTLSQYLGRGATSRGKTTITSGLSMTVSTVPYLHDANDVAAVITGVQHLQTALSTVKDLTFVSPAPGQSAADFVNNMAVTSALRRSNHWIGSAKMGTDDGRSSVGGTSVVDTNCKVYGTDNLFVVDASIFPGMVSTNPSALIVTVAERASDLILALAAPSTLARYGTCGGLTYTGSSVCAAPYTCTYVSDYFWQCM